jgi:hypothetical protein
MKFTYYRQSSRRKLSAGGLTRRAPFESVGKKLTNGDVNVMRTKAVNLMGNAARLVPVLRCPDCNADLNFDPRDRRYLGPLYSAVGATSSWLR